MKVLFVSNLYPNSLEPSRGIFNGYQIQHLAKLCEARVVAPIAWFPIRGRFAPKGPLPAEETLDGIRVLHPRHFYFPKIARPFNAFFFAAGIRGTLARVYREFPFEIMFVNWTFPDACGVARLAPRYRVPFVVSVSGSDAHVYLTFRIRRRQILRTLDECHAITVRSQDLKNMLVAYGVPPAKVHVIYNGVDPHRFRRLPRADARRQLGWPVDERIVLFAGRLSPEKGAHDLLRGFAHARRYYRLQARLIIVGDGPQRESLERLARQLGLNGDVLWAGWKTPDEVNTCINAADWVCLPSHNEGVANVALESLACGVPLVASAVGGLPEILTDDAGVMTTPQQPESIAAGLVKAAGRTWNPEAIRACAARFDWDANARQLHELLVRVRHEFRG